MKHWSLLLPVIGIATGCSKAEKPAAELPTQSAVYDCDNGDKITAVYDDYRVENPKVFLTIKGNQYTLDQADAASGARYTSASGLSAGKAMEWWSKGNEAWLSEGPQNLHYLMSEGTLVASCKETRKS